MTLMRYTDLSARPRHNNNHVLTQTPIITEPIIAICATDFSHWSSSFVQYGFINNVSSNEVVLSVINQLILHPAVYKKKTDLLIVAPLVTFYWHAKLISGAHFSLQRRLHNPAWNLQSSLVWLRLSVRGWSIFLFWLVNNKNVSSLSTRNELPQWEVKHKVSVTQSHWCLINPWVRS